MKNYPKLIKIKSFNNVASKCFPLNIENCGVDFFYSDSDSASEFFLFPMPILTPTPKKNSKFIPTPIPKNSENLFCNVRILILMIVSASLDSEIFLDQCFFSCR